MAQAMSGRDPATVTVDAVVAGEVGADDVRIHPDQLIIQAEVAEKHGNPQLAANLRRAAELALLPDDEVMGLYDALRPGRTMPARLLEIAEDLRGRGAPGCADLFVEAAAVYTRRGLTP